MAYVAPSITAQGYVAPERADILAQLISVFQSSYGQNVYLGPDSSDYQFLSIISLVASDAVDASRLAYNQRSILTAVGAGLDAFGSFFSAPRKAASYSTVALTITGASGTVITGGSARDNTGVYWSLPSPVTIPSSGVLTVSASCATLGSVSASPGTITNINGGQAGWTGVNNPQSAFPGQPTEKDSQYRARLLSSTAINSQTLLTGTQAQLAALPGVTRLNVFDNKTNAADALGTPAHSITCVVEGGLNASIASVIAANNNFSLPNGAAPQAGGSTSYTYTDPITGVQEIIGYYRPTYVPIYVALTIHPLVGYTTQVAAAITANLTAYLNSLEIGQQVTYGELYAVVYQMPSNNPLFATRSLFLGTSANPTGTSDIVMAFYGVAQGVSANIAVTTA